MSRVHEHGGCPCVLSAAAVKLAVRLPDRSANRARSFGGAWHSLRCNECIRAAQTDLWSRFGKSHDYVRADAGAQALECETFLRREADLAGKHTLNERLVTLAEMKGGARFHQVVEGPLSGRIKLFPRGILLNR